MYIPKNTASIFTTYTFDSGRLSGVFVGGGGRFVGSVKTSYTGETKDIPDYALADATAGYDLEKWRFQLNIRNIFNKYYFINNYKTLFYGNFPGEARNFTVSVRRFF